MEEKGDKGICERERERVTGTVGAGWYTQCTLGTPTCQMTRYTRSGPPGVSTLTCVEITLSFFLKLDPILHVTMMFNKPLTSCIVWV